MQQQGGPKNIFTPITAIIFYSQQGEYLSQIRVNI